jgi:phosphate acyltransferase
LEKITISIDAMGGDYGPVVTVPAAFRLLAKYRNVQLILVGNQEVLNTAVASYGNSEHKSRIVIRHASEEVLMDDLPSKALRTKKDSSMRVAINLVKEGVAKACVSAGNTGALVATARFVLKTLPGIDRPAITTHFPTMIPNKGTNILDLGANVDSSADYLCQFAIMGSVLSSVVDNIPKPKVALLNIGSEEIKGNEQIKKAAQLLSQNKNINYVGFVEGDDLFKGNVDVVICDGFIGNIVLKTIEGALKLVGFYAKRNMMRNIFTKLTAVLALPMLRGLQRDIDPGKYNGATLVGLQGVVIKSHGGARAIAFFYALEKAVIEAEKNVPQTIRNELTRILKDTVN